jgi:hypothetical protein
MSGRNHSIFGKMMMKIAHRRRAGRSPLALDVPSRLVFENGEFAVLNARLSKSML